MHTGVTAVHEEDEVESLLRLMRERELPGVPVVDHSDRVVGIVTESDLVLRDAAGDLRLPHHIDLMGGVIYLESTKHYEEKLRRALASDVGGMMTRNPVTVGPDESVGHAARLISKHGHNRLPVVDADRKLLGVVTRVDVLEALAG